MKYLNLNADIPDTIMVGSRFVDIDLDENGKAMEKCKIDMWHSEVYDTARHDVQGIYWSDGRLCYWGWIYDRTTGKVGGDFTADSVQDAEKALGVEFTCN